MATWVIGDVHGCWLTLENLLRRIDWRPDRDELWFVGDLVNRGPSSLEVLRWAYEHREGLEVVLGNHDLHLLSVAAGVRREKKDDTFADVLQASDREELLEWLRTRPLFHQFGPFAMVHAGLLPEWNIERTRALSVAAEERLSGEDHRTFLRNLFEVPQKDASADQGDDCGLAFAVAAMTRLRMVDGDGRARLGFSGGPGAAPREWRPWFEKSTVRRQGYALVFGHWAMLGFHREHDLACVDSGCVYGGDLSALRLNDGEVVREPVADAVVMRNCSKLP
jgi:bis(5'-nucleosyl)-tetraphosphatase (symmetrical)